MQCLYNNARYLLAFFGLEAARKDYVEVYIDRVLTVKGEAKWTITVRVFSKQPHFDALFELAPEGYVAQDGRTVLFDDRREAKADVLKLAERFGLDADWELASRSAVWGLR